MSLRKLLCKFGFHLWSYGGYKVTWSDDSWSISGYRVCILCVPYVRQRWRHGCVEKGKAKWINMSAEEYRDKKE